MLVPGNGGGCRVLFLRSQSGHDERQLRRLVQGLEGRGGGEVRGVVGRGCGRSVGGGIEGRDSVTTDEGGDIKVADGLAWTWISRIHCR